MTSPLVSVRPATTADALYVGAHLRAADRAEVEALSGRPPVEVLLDSVTASSMAWAGCVDDEPVCLFGVAPMSLAGVVGFPWLLGTDGVLDHAAAFLRRNKAYLGQMLAEYPILRNVVDARNEVSIRWLRWLGFQFGTARPMGAANLPFIPFEMRRAA